MSYYPSTCSTPIPDHVCDPCDHREFGRIRSAGFIHREFTFTNPADPAEWLAGIQSKQIIVIPETNGELPEPTEKTGAGYGDTVETLLGYEFHAKVTDPDYVGNCAFYNALVGNRNFKFFYRTSSKVHITDKPVAIIPKKVIPNDLNGEVVWHVSVKWQDNKFPCPIDTPTGVMQCWTSQ